MILTLSENKNQTTAYKGLLRENRSSKKQEAPPRIRRMKRHSAEIRYDDVLASIMLEATYRRLQRKRKKEGIIRTLLSSSCAFLERERVGVMDLHPAFFVFVFVCFGNYMRTNCAMLPVCVVVIIIVFLCVLFAFSAVFAVLPLLLLNVRCS